MPGSLLPAITSHAAKASWTAFCDCYASSGHLPTVNAFRMKMFFFSHIAKRLPNLERVPLRGVHLGVGVGNGASESSQKKQAWGAACACSADSGHL